MLHIFHHNQPGYIGKHFSEMFVIFARRDKNTITRTDMNKLAIEIDFHLSVQDISDVSISAPVRLDKFFREFNQPQPSTIAIVCFESNPLHRTFPSNRIEIDFTFFHFHLPFLMDNVTRDRR